MPSGRHDGVGSMGKGTADVSADRRRLYGPYWMSSDQTRSRLRISARTLS